MVNIWFLKYCVKIDSCMLSRTQHVHLHYIPVVLIPRRTGTIEEVAAITKFIVSKEASFNTACCFDLSGGRATY